MLIALTGGPFAGKTTTIEALAAAGHPIVPEAAWRKIDEWNQQMGVDGQMAWRREHPHEVQLAINTLQAESEAAAVAAHPDSPYIFCDRGRPDGLAYLRVYDVEPRDELKRNAATQQYDAAFLLDRLPDLDLRHETGRMDEPELLDRLDDLFIAAYREHGANPIRVPVMPVADRVAFILSELAELAGDPAPGQ